MPEIEPVALADLTTLRVGAAPDRMVEAQTRDELIGALRDVWATGEPWLVVGGGSNLLVGDEPFEGTVVLVRTRGIERLPSPREGYTRLRVEAGHDWDALGRIHQKGLIADPIGKSKSVRFTPEGLELSRQLFEKNFCRPSHRNQR